MLQIILFSGYFINRTVLRQELGLADCPDTEILLRGFSSGGTSFFEKLNGLFSFVLYDTDSRRFYACRDRFGGRGLYYTLGADGMPVFSETISELLRKAGRQAEFCETMLELYLSYSYLPGEDTVFSGVKKPLAGYWYCFQNGTVRKARYFTPRFLFEHHSVSEWTDRLCDTLDAVFAPIEPGGASLLSSGIDSSYLCKRLSVKDTYTAAYDRPEVSEAETAADFSVQIGARHHAVSITAEDYLAAVPQVMRALEQPSGDASAVALYLVCRQIRKDAKVCFSGEGIDELFFGYYYRDLRAIPETQSLWDAGYIGCTSALTEAEKKALLKQDFIPAKMQIAQEAYALSANGGRMEQAAMLDLVLWLNGNLLPNLYALSEATGLSVQTPYLDNRLYDLALTIPPELETDGEDTKHLFRLAAQRVLDRKTAMRPKRGFPVPIRRWLRRADYVQTLRQTFRSDTAGHFFNCEALLAFYDKMLQNPDDMDMWRPIWCIYCFLVWYDEMIPPQH